MKNLLVPLLLLSLAASTSLTASTLTAGNDRSESAAASTDRAEPGTAPAARSPRQALDAWLESFNKHDATEREQWLLDNTTLPPEQAKQIAEIDQKIRSSHGPFEVVRVVRTEGPTIEVEARHTGSGAGARIKVTLDEEQPKRIADVQLEQAEVKGNGDGPG